MDRYTVTRTWAEANGRRHGTSRSAHQSYREAYAEAGRVADEIAAKGLHTCSGEFSWTWYAVDNNGIEYTVDIRHC